MVCVCAGGLPVAGDRVTRCVCVQGVWQGVLTGAGCLSRALGPVFVAAVYARHGPVATFGSTAALTLAALAALRAVYGRLRPAPLAARPAAEHELRAFAQDET